MDFGVCGLGLLEFFSCLCLLTMTRVMVTDIAAVIPQTLHSKPRAKPCVKATAREAYSSEILGAKLSETLLFSFRFIGFTGFRSSETFVNTGPSRQTKIRSDP